MVDEVGFDCVVIMVGVGSREVNWYLFRIGFVPLFVHWVVSVIVLRRFFGLADAFERLAVLRWVRLVCV